MKNLYYMASLLVVLFCLSLLDKFFILMALLLSLLLFITYMYFVSRKRKLSVLTIAYVGFSFSFAAYAVSTILNSNNFITHSFVTLLILSVITPTFFWGGYIFLSNLFHELYWCHKYLLCRHFSIVSA